MDIEKQIGHQLANERGMPGVGVAIWAKDHCIKEVYFQGTVGEFLLTASRNVVWCIDGGWGGPPGPIFVKFIDGAWSNGGFLGARW